MLRVDVVVAMEPPNLRARNGSRSGRDGGALLRRPIGFRIAGFGWHEQDGNAYRGVTLRRSMLPEAAQHDEMALEGQPRRDRAVGPDLEVGERSADAGLRPVWV